MAVTADSNVGFKGTVDTAQWAKVAGMGARYAVLGSGDLKVTAGGSGDRAVTVAAGEAWGDGVLSSFDTSTNLNGTSVASGTRWDTLVVRRTWQPALTPTGLAELVILPGSASKAIAASRTTDAGATTSDQPIALLRFAAGSTVVQEIVDLRVWAGLGGGLVAGNTDALLYLTDVGTAVTVAGVTYTRELDSGGNGVWLTPPASVVYEITQSSAGPAPAGVVVRKKIHRVASTQTNGSGVILLTFPTAFPTACANVVITTTSGTGVAGVVNADAITRTGFNVIFPGAPNTFVSFNYEATGW